MTRVCCMKHNAPRKKVCLKMMTNLFGNLCLILLFYGHNAVEKSFNVMMIFHKANYTVQEFSLYINNYINIIKIFLIFMPIYNQFIN